MDAGTNLEAIAGAKARTEEAAAALAALAEEANSLTEAVLKRFEDLNNAALTAASAAEAAHQGAAGAREAAEQHLNSTPGDHKTVMAIITAKNACETATLGLGNATDLATAAPGDLEALTNDFTTAIGALVAGKIEEIQGQISQSAAELDTAEVHISSIKD
jgi:hypothetical protein